MNFDQLAYFIAVAEEPNYYDAAERMNISQSSLSKQILHLETELDCPLLDRSHRKAVLTPAGKAFYKEARQMLAQYHASLKLIANYRTDAESTVHIGLLPFQTQYALPQLFHDFSLKFPNVKLERTELEDLELLRRFQNGEFDCIIARKYMCNEMEIEWLPLETDQFVALLSEEHSLANRSSITLEELSKEPLMLHNPYTAIHRRCLEEFRKAGLRPRLIGTERVESIIGSVYMQEAVSMLPESNFRVFNHGGLKMIPFDPPITLEIGIGYPKLSKKTSALTSFLDFSKSYQW